MNGTLVIETNLKAVFRLSKLVMRGMMKARFGRIINITSVVGEAGNPGQANYAAAKAGVAGMSRALAQELGSRNITVNCVAPGFIDTDMTRALPDAQRDALLGKIPLGRLGAAGGDRGDRGISGLDSAPAISPAPRCTSMVACIWPDRMSNPRGRPAFAKIAQVFITRTLHGRSFKMENIEQRVKKIVAEQLGVNEADIKNESIVRRRSGRRFAGHRRTGDGAGRRVRVRDSGRRCREDHHRAAGD